jgi:hypothetical protein
MWNVILHFSRGSAQTIKFANKADALKCIGTVVFNNEDCINCSIYKDTQSVVAKQPSVEKILSKV